MVEIKYTPVQPKDQRRYLRASESYNAILTEFGALALNYLKTYPPWMPWTSRPPKTGPRAGGKRTGTLGRNWTSSFVRTAKGSGTVGSLIMSVQVANKTSYASYVQGTTQTRVMAARGWPKVNDKEISNLWSQAIRKNSA